jgi:soluble lytic murein transglycosylase-like protein
MQSGLAPSTILPALFLSPMPMVGCGDAQYRPRNDLTAATEQRRLQHFPLIAAIACQEKIPVALFDALIWQESRYQVLARSPKGAIGLAQLMPGTARELGVADPWDVVQNLRGGARYLRMQIEEFGRYDLALAAYNAGPGRVRATRSIPRIRETIDYVRTITAAWANAEQRGPTRFAGPSIVPALGRPQRASVADYTSTSVANPR